MAGLPLGVGRFVVGRYDVEVGALRALKQLLGLLAAQLGVAVLLLAHLTVVDLSWPDDRPWPIFRAALEPLVHVWPVERVFLLLVLGLRATQLARSVGAGAASPRAIVEGVLATRVVRSHGTVVLLELFRTRVVLLEGAHLGVLSTVWARVPV